MNATQKSLRGMLLIMLFLAALLPAGGCDSSPPPQTVQLAAKPLFGVLVYKKDDVYISSVVDALKRAMGDRGTLALYYAEEEQLTQNEQFNEILAAKPAGIAVNIVDTQAAADLVDKAKKAGIPLVFFNREPDMDVLKRYGKVCYVGSIAADAGKMQGTLIAKLWREHPEYDRNKDGKFQYVMLRGNADNVEALSRTEFSVKQAREEGVSMQQIGETHVCNWSRELARQAMETELASNDKIIEMVVANNDSMALGAIDALTARGYNKVGGDPSRFIPVVGVDAIDDAVEAIQKGSMSATVKQDGDAMGKAIVALLLNIAANRDFLEGTPYVWDASGIAVRIPYTPYTPATR